MRREPKMTSDVRAVIRDQIVEALKESVGFVEEQTLGEAELLEAVYSNPEAWQTFLGNLVRRVGPASILTAELRVPCRDLNLLIQKIFDAVHGNKPVV